MYARQKQQSTSPPVASRVTGTPRVAAGGFTYYKVSNLDNRISNADQLLTTDIDKFCDTVVDLYSNTSKPLLDIGIYLYRLTVNLGASLLTTDIDKFCDTVVDLYSNTSKPLLDIGIYLYRLTVNLGASVRHFQRHHILRHRRRFVQQHQRTATGHRHLLVPPHSQPGRLANDTIFCDTVADLYSNTSKPLLDIGIYMYRLTVNLGASVRHFQRHHILRHRRRFVQQHQQTATGYRHLHVPPHSQPGRLDTRHHDGVLACIWSIPDLPQKAHRYVNSRLITNSEEIAFYQGNNREQLTILASFYKLTRHLRSFLNFRVGMGFLDNIIAKLKMAEGIGRLVLSGRELSKLAGLTARMTQLRVVLDDINKGNYTRTMVDRPAAIANGDADPQVALKPGAGRIIYQDKIIKFDKVPLVTPNGDVLIKELSFEVKSGINVLVCGPNGCGKSSLFRQLGELWPTFGGTLTKPPKGKLFYVIYPQTRDEMSRRGRTDEQLSRFLEIVQLSYLTGREGGWDAVEDWMDILPVGTVFAFRSSYARSNSWITRPADMPNES
ncbi:Peroxisomal membrane protein [Operophtera brumata]|uniref:Peroxisomal membrane protein n=1 Tax=Operophtera brumata TaxID=104452 RepID=A0A0L7L9Z0_OPEBR|nr:Peroxisomal membrane protein [Operophtera brumata]